MITLKCQNPNCGKEFEVIPSRAERTKYCSWECRFPLTEVKCQTCGKLFKIKPSVIKKGHAKYCSLECRYSPQRVTKTCKQCGKEFTIPKSQTLNGYGIYCSKKCHNKSMIKEVEVICETCGTSFNTLPMHVKRGRKFCSLSCFAKSREIRVERTCAHCGKIFKTRIGNIKYGYGKFCSKDCQNKWAVGKNASAWKGGISFEPYCPLFNEEFKERCREFWGRVCGICGKTEVSNGQKLGVHHITYDKESCCNNSPPIFLPTCRSCHSRTNRNRSTWKQILTEYIMIWFDGESYLPK